ncbi:Cytochrome P450 9e2 [Melipona quadrifasciata]|uniref:Cytochrome P450 9e2 n=1 Tax=Melipona quadrifasciata TaxID=166423 RepID=A0A0M8ZXH8_9HYME|nr:Cytochrome P450 9e2 [Melipona quadrifasciata]
MTPVLMIRDERFIKSMAIVNFEHIRNHRNFGDQRVDPSSVIPYAKPMPFVGNMWEAFFQRSFAEIVEKIYNSNPDSKYVGFFEFDTPVLLIRDLDLIKSITVKNFHHFPNHRLASDPDLDPLFSKNIFSLRGEKWKEVRKILTWAFTPSKMRSMFVLLRYSSDVSVICMFGIDVNSLIDPKNPYYVNMREASFGKAQSLRLFAARNFPWLCQLLGITVFKQKVIEFFKDLVTGTIKIRDENGIVRSDMIQLMMETRGKLEPGKELTIDDMTAQAFIFFLGGFETVSTLLSFAAYEIGINDDIQKRLQDEIDQVLEDCNGEVTYEAINGMKYLEAVIFESLRMYPPFAATGRACAKPFELPPRVPGAKPYVVQANETVCIPIYGIHHDPQYYPEPKKFNPDRFYDNPIEVAKFHSFLSFGLGPRMCIGYRFALLETKVLLFHIFAKCDLAPCSKSSIPLKLNRKGFSMTLENGFWLKVQPRTAKSAGSEKIAIPGTTMLIETIPDKHPDD